MKEPITNPMPLPPNTGVYYAKPDYAGFWLRVLAWCIDIMIILLILWSYFLVFNYYSQWSESEFKILFWLSLVTCHIYLVVIKNTKISTVGFWLTNIRVVDLHGNKPSFLKMTFRFLLLSIGPFELVTDLLWLTGEETKQTLRDKFVGTYVVKKSAFPCGTAKIVQKRLCFLGWNLLFSEVVIPQNSMVEEN